MLETYSKQERAEILRRYRNLIEVWHTRKSTADRWKVRKAFRVAAEAHKDMRRRSGEPYIYHPLDVATISAGEIGLGRTSIICALLHDVVEDTEYKLNDIQMMFGEPIARIIDGLTKLDDLEEKEFTSLQAENFKKLLLTLSYDVRVILIKLADRLHNMRTLDAMPREKRYKISSETLVLYAPLAYRLGLYAVKSELQDLSLKYMQPEIYHDIRKKLAHTREKRNERIQRFLEPICNSLDQMNIQYRTQISEKPVSAIFERMTENEIPFEEVHDTFVLRFIISCAEAEEKIECWRVYATITSHYKPNNDRLRDWISLPKANGYESLHATVMSQTGKWIDVQIRSERMDEIAEKGYAAYWKYKDSPHSESGLDEWLTKVRELLRADDESAIDFVDSFKLNLFSEEIFVFTPKGEMVSLPVGSTALDFAYNIHTELGNQCIGANVNHKLVQLNHVLKTGDQVEIITSKVQKPKEEWFDFLVTARAKSRLKDRIREDRKSYKDQGRKKLETYFEQINVEPTKANINQLIEAEGLSGLVDLYYYTAIDRINLARIRNVFREKTTGFFKLFSNPFSKAKDQKESASSKSNGNDATSSPALLSEKTNELNYTISKCCNPIPGDEVIALDFENEPLHIHRVSCPVAAKQMSQYGENIVKAKWRQKEGVSFLAGLKITGTDSIGFIHRVSDVISNQLELNIRSMQLKSTGGLVEAVVTIYVHNAQNLKDLIEKLKKLKDVRKVSRLERVEKTEK